MKGKLYFYTETGTEGGYWAFDEDGYSGYDALRILEDGDYLMVFDEDGNCLFDDEINLIHYDLFTQTEPYYNMWIHADQSGVDRSIWSRWF